MLANAKVDQARYETLVKQNAVPEQQLATQISLVKQRGRHREIRSGDDRGGQAQPDLLSHHRADWREEGLRLMDPGNIVHGSDANGMIVITQLQPISVIYTVAEDQLPAVLPR